METKPASLEKIAFYPVPFPQLPLLLLLSAEYMFTFQILKLHP